MIVTGDNNCGKTTLARSITLALLTAKMGFCYADKAEMSHFGYIRTSMKITDSGSDEAGATLREKVAL